VDHHYQDELFFRTACENGHLETAQMIVTISKPNIHVLDNDAFRKACANNHIDVSRWLYNICPQKFDFTTLTECYNTAKQNNNKDIIEWLLTIYKPVVTNVYEIFNMDILAIDNNISPPNIIIPGGRDINISPPNIIIPRRRDINKRNANKNIVVRITKFFRPPENRREYILYTIIGTLIFILILMIIIAICSGSLIILYHIFG
jgi:hypothetical protein